MLEVVKDEKIVYFLSINTVTLQKEKTLLMSRFCSFFFFFPLLVICLHIFKNSFPQNLYRVFFSS